MSKLRVGVLISGGGTNLQAIIDACEAGTLEAEVVVVISNRAAAYGLERARRHGIPAVALDRRTFPSDEDFNRAILTHLEAHQVELVVLAGYLRILSAELIRAYAGRIINIHPALLPSFGGPGMYGHHVHKAVLERGCKVSGCTVHFVTEGIDAGPIILQRPVPVEENDTPETLAARVLVQEHQALPEAIQLFAQGRLEIEGSQRVRILSPTEARRRQPGRKIERAILSVSDKTGLVEFAQGLRDLGVEILSTGGTARLLREAGVPAIEVSDYTGFPEMMDGRVKTLHPKIHGGLLARRDHPSDLEEAAAHGIHLIDLVVVNLYPFEQTVAQPNVSLAEAIENIDIGGPTMLRAAAKNHASVAVICNPSRYEEVLAELRDNAGALSQATRRSLALEAFRHTAHYDAAIARYLAQQYEPQERPFPRIFSLTLEKVCDLKSREAPERRAAFYREVGRARYGLVGVTQLQGPELTFEQLREAAEAWKQCLSSGKPTTVGEAIAAPGPVGEEAATEWAGRPLRVVVAPCFEEKALEILQRQENWILLSLEHATAPQSPGWDFLQVGNGFLVWESRSGSTSSPNASQRRSQGC